MTQNGTVQDEQSIQVTLRLSKSLYQRAIQTAEREQRPIEEILSQKLAQSLDIDEVYKHMQEVSTQYRARLARESKLNQSSDEVLRELRVVREGVADELYPD